jgi:ferredoxin
VIPVIDKDKCNGCEDCVEACPPQAISMNDGKAVINERFCEECSECIDECPEGAISLGVKS